ncbi:MAG: cbb3-type cytochrome c oxidase subunit I [Gemmatimonadaceae bacterium]|nr:cbb3-type cytochrome c oxidase subunit I [Gemmatimonadaceae bacterium]
MEWFVRNFIKASLAWLALGVSLGVAMAMVPHWVVYRAAHMHMNLIGFVTMMIYGVAYHVIPRFSGNALYSPRLATVHWGCANAGLACMVGGFLLRPHVGTGAMALLGLGAVLSAAGAYMFVYGLWRTIDGDRALRRAQARVRASAGTPLPVAR